MTNREIANTFKLVANLMELHDENSFKIKSFNNAYLSLRKFERSLSELSISEITSIPGMGKSSAQQVLDIIGNGSLKILDELLLKTPPGVVQMLQVRGLGPKKVGAIWKEMQIEDISDLLLACNENRLVSLKGFGLKTQEDIKSKIEFYLSNSGKFLYAVVADAAHDFKSLLQKNYPDDLFELTGLLRRKMPELIGIEILTTSKREKIILHASLEEDSEIVTFRNLPVIVYECERKNFFLHLFKQSCSEAFLNGVTLDEAISYENENEIFQKNAMSFVYPEYRETIKAFNQAKENTLPTLLDISDIRGVVHCHSTYSDGLNTLREMADESIKLGYDYMVITDHSKSATYANGLTLERLEMQWREIDELNESLQNFKIYKGIESDILGDGNLDYDDDTLSQFDLIIASIHSNLKMDKDKATARLIKAIEHPYTHILGHPTARLLLGRSGYEIDHVKVIDACSSNGVAIEINSNPQRLDLDWNWIDYTLSRNVVISINPDAHSTGQIAYIKYGIEAARKGGLTHKMCLNCKPLAEFEQWLKDVKL